MPAFAVDLHSAAEVLAGRERGGEAYTATRDIGSYDSGRQAVLPEGGYEVLMMTTRQAAGLRPFADGLPIYAVPVVFDLDPHSVVVVDNRETKSAGL